MEDQAKAAKYVQVQELYSRGRSKSFIRIAPHEKSSNMSNTIQFMLRNRNAVCSVEKDRVGAKDHGHNAFLIAFNVISFLAAHSITPQAAYEMSNIEDSAIQEKLVNVMEAYSLFFLE